MNHPKFAVGRTRGIPWLLAVTLALAACSGSRLRNEHLAHWKPNAGYPTPAQVAGNRSGDLLLFVAFSGGGTRAAALSYGVLEELRDTPLPGAGRRHRLLDEIDVISGVSGGSFPAAYYALYGDWIFKDFESRFLKNDVQGELVARLFDPGNWIKQFSPFYSRWEIAAEYYDEELFHGATFGDLAGRPGPYVLINSTDLSTGNRFAFNQSYFDMICSDLAKFPLSVAVTASSAVPVVFTPITLQNFAGSCGYQPLSWLNSSVADPKSPVRRRIYAKQRLSLLDATQRRYVHLLDGGISDNLGIREPYDLVIKEGPNLARVLQETGHPDVRDIVFLVVNSQTEPVYSWAISDLSPAISDVLGAVTSVQIDRYNFETLDLVQSAFDKWTRELSTAEHPVRFHMIQVSFDDLQDDQRRRYFNNLPTNFSLPPEDVDQLRSAGREILRTNSDFRALMNRLSSRCPETRAAGAPSDASRCEAEPAQPGAHRQAHTSGRAH